MTFSEGHINKAKPLEKHEANPTYNYWKRWGEIPCHFSSLFSEKTNFVVE